MIPAVGFEVTGARHVPHAAAPTIAFALTAADDSGREVYTVALTAQIQIAPIQRRHDDVTRARLRDVFGDPERWGDTARGVTWATQQLLVPSFRGSRDFELVLPCNADLELATTRYFEAVPDGIVPLVFHFSGSIFYCGDEDRMQLAQVDWSTTAPFELPVAVWQAATSGRGGLVRVGDETFAALQREQADRGLPTVDAVVSELLTVRAP